MRIDHKLLLALSGLAMAALLASCGDGKAIQIEAFDELVWDPASVTVQAGEAVTFVVTNDGSSSRRSCR
jgi:plastocyanin